MVGEGIGDAVVAGGFVEPTTVAGVGLEGHDVGALRLERAAEFRSGDEVVAGFADVGIGTGPGRFVTGAVAMGNRSFEHLAAEPTDGVRDDRLADRSEREPPPHRARRLLIGVTQRRRRQSRVTQTHLRGDVFDMRVITVRSRGLDEDRV